MSLPDTVFESIYLAHSHSLKHTAIPHKKLILAFSGIAGSGKTTLAKKLEEKYLGVRINSDELRGLLDKIFPGTSIPEREKILHSYLYQLIQDWNNPNQLLILDKGIERDYDKIKDIADKSGFQIFIISIEVEEKLAHKRVVARNGGKEDQHFLDSIVRWKREHDEFSSKVKGDYILYAEDNPGLEPLYEKLSRLCTD